MPIPTDNKAKRLYSSAKTFICHVPWGILLLTLMSIYLFSGMSEKKTSVANDLIQHVKFTFRDFAHGEIQGHFLFHALVFYLSKIWNGSQPGLTAAIVVMTASIVGKFIFTRKAVFEEISLSRNLLFLETPKNWQHFVLAGAVSFMLVFVMAFPQSSYLYDVYLGKISPNFWHNPTLLLAMPFAIYVHYQTCAFFEHGKQLNLPLCSLALVLSTLAKPIYIVLFSPAFILFFLMNRKKNALKISELFVLLAPAILTFLIQYLYIFDSSDGQKNGISFSPLTVWGRWTDNIPLALLTSLAFPLSVVLFFHKTVFKDKGFGFSLIVFLISILISGSLIETGHRKWDGNFLWYDRCGTYLLFVYSAIFLIKKQLNCGLKSHRFQTIICTFLFFTHFCFGMNYFYGMSTKSMIGFGNLITIQRKLGKQKKNLHPYLPDKVKKNHDP